MPVVVDTNVLATANKFADHVDPECVESCIKELRRIHDADVVAIDTGMRILREYRTYASLKGQPGPGDFFLKWLWSNQANPGHCVQVEITPREDDPTNFVEFSDDPDLAGFDPADRKWVAVALGCDPIANIDNATDTDWWNDREALVRHGIEVNFLCPKLMSD
ncbi:MAG TPA: hypothetical protein VNH11_07920 [Pirellulales bacterium]|nr:hypothetical protein [Pirellulales bacterium]